MLQLIPGFALSIVISVLRMSLLASGVLFQMTAKFVFFCLINKKNAVWEAARPQFATDLKFPRLNCNKL